MMAFTLNGVLYALGDAAPNRKFLIVAFFANIILDLWFISGGLGLPPQGIRGIGLATVLCEAGGAVYLGICVWGILGVTWSAALFAYFYAGGVLKKAFDPGKPDAGRMGDEVA